MVYWLKIELGLKFCHYQSLELDRYIWSADIYQAILGPSRYIVLALYADKILA